MPEDPRERQLVKGMTHLLSRMEVDGVAVVGVRDGYVMAFSKKKLLELVDACDRSREEKVIFVVRDAVGAAEVDTSGKSDN